MTGAQAVPKRRAGSAAATPRGADAVVAAGEAPVPVLKDAAVRATGLVDVGMNVDAAGQEHGLFALAAGKRRSGGSFLADFASALLDHATASQSQIFQDVFALFVNGFAKNGYFIEVGTGDGELISNTYLLEKEFGWSGMVVEPNPVFLPSLQANRTCRISTDCVYDVSGRTVRFRCTADPEFSGIAERHADLHAEKSAGEFREIEKVTLSLHDLLTQNDCPSVIDYLSLDVEGAEFEILQPFDFSSRTIRCLTVEHNWTATRDNVFDLLTENGYVRVFEHLSQWDDWYVRKDVLVQFPTGRNLIDRVEDDSDAPDAGKFLAWALEALARSELPVAETLCLRALEIEPDFSAGFRTLAEIAMRRGRRAQALAHWRAAVAADPDDYWSRVGLAEMLASRGAIAEAVTLLRGAVDPQGESGRARELHDMLAKKLPGGSGG